MSEKEPILVSGASGQQGGAVMKSLTQQGLKVRALTRKSSTAEALKSSEVEVFMGDLCDRASLDLALKGVKKVFLMTTFFEEGMEAEVRQGITMIDAAQAAGVEHLVFSSVSSADKNTGIPHFESKWKVEQYIHKVGLPATILRPVGFMENFGTYWPPSPEGVLSLPLWPETSSMMIALRDIGAFAAAAFTRPEDFIGESIDLASDTLTMPEVAEALSKTMHRPIRFEPLPDEQAEAALGRDFALMFDWFNRVGYSVDIPALEKKWKVPLTRFKTFLQFVSWAKPMSK